MADDSQNTNSPVGPSVSSQMDLNPPTVSVSGYGGKEMQPISEKKSDQLSVAAEVPTSPETAKLPEAAYVENVDKKTQLPDVVMDDYTGQVLLKSANPQNVVVTLPLTEAQVAEGLHHQVWESIRWMAEWCVRQILLLKGRVQYKNP